MTNPRTAAFDISYEVMDQRLKDIDDGYDLPGIHPDGSGSHRYWAQMAKRQLAENAETIVTSLTWNMLLAADFNLIRSEETDKGRRARLVEMAATIVANIDDIDRRSYDREPRVPLPTVKVSWEQFADDMSGRAEEFLARHAPRFIPLSQIKLTGVTA